MSLIYIYTSTTIVNPLNTELNPICHLLALLGAHHILHVSRIRVKQNCKMRQSPQIFQKSRSHLEFKWLGECLEAGPLLRALKY